MLDYFSSPMKLFGRIGLWCCGLGGVSLAATLGMKLGSGVDMTGNPLLLLSMLSAMLGVQFLSLGLLGEVTVRIYFDRQHKQPFAIAKLVGFDSENPTIVPLKRAS
jgi:hypothetical protein